MTKTAQDDDSDDDGDDGDPPDLDELRAGSNAKTTVGRGNGSSLEAMPVTRGAWDTKTLCFRIGTTFLADGTGEDSYTNTTRTFRDAIGNRIVLDGPTYESFWLDDDGCYTGTIYEGDWYDVIVRYEGWIQLAADYPRYLRVQESGQSAASLSEVSVYIDTASTQTIDIEFFGDNNFEAAHIYQAAAWALRSHKGIGSGDVIIERGSATAPCTGGVPGYCPLSGKIHMGAAYQLKFQVAHELGHRIHDLAGARIPGGANYTLAGGGACTDLGVWSWISKEFQSAAYTEGFANFYEADAFNSHSDVDCWMWDIDCDEGSGPSGDLPIKHKWFEDACYNPKGGRGSIVDWTRVFWNVHTHGSSDPSMNEMLEWMRDADDQTAWSDVNPFSLLEAEANQKQGTLNSRWDTHTAEHGIDHPCPTQNPPPGCP